MISRRDVTPISIYTSKSPKSTGGPPNIVIQDRLEVEFGKISSFYGETIYRFLYAVYDLETSEEIYKIRLSYSVNIASVADKYDIYFLQNLSINFFYLTPWRKNYIVELYDEFGYNTKTNKHVSEQIEKKEGELELFTRLSSGDFFPIGLEISLKGPTERIYKLPIIVQFKSYAV
jgi:hypothetical protein